MSTKKRKKLVIIDGNALIHRSFHALPPTITTKDGEMVNAVYGFTSVLLKALKDFKPEYVALTLDMKGPTFRHEAFADYKGTRTKAPDELYLQIPRIKEIANVFNIPIYEMSGFEADDLIGTITKKVNGDIDKIIVTGDMDTMQLVNDHTKVFTMSRGLSDSVIYDADAVFARYGLRVDQMIDYKALRGDPSDNIPGVKGIGEKTAVGLLTDFGTLDNLYANIDSPKIKDRIRGLLTEHKDNAYMSKMLATIKCDAPINFDLPGAVFGDYDQDKIVELFSELEFKSLLGRLQELGKKNEVQSAIQSNGDKFERNRNSFKYQLIITDKDFDAFLKNLKKQSIFTFDTETSSLDQQSSDLLGISFSWEMGVAYFIKMSTDGKSKTAVQNLFNYQEKNTSTANQDWLEKLKPVFADEKIKKCGHNMKFDIKVLASNGVVTRGAYFDTMIASYLLNPGNRQHNLDTVVFAELGFEKINKDDLLGKGKNKISFNEVEIEKLSLYSCEDADFTNQLVAKLQADLKKQNLENLFFEIEMPLVQVLAEMESNGIKIDIDFLHKASVSIAAKIKDLEKRIHNLSGSPFNIKSTQQLREVLFEKLNISTQNLGKTKTGISTASEELIKLKDEHEIIPLIQEYRELTKLASTYIDALPELVNTKTGRLHSSFNQTVAATGRLSSTDPNLQNIPVRTELGREIRKAFVADKGFVLASLDYSQIELRIAAHMSEDVKMIQAFLDGVDIHTATAAEINHIPLDQVTKEMRREAKATNFGVLYGQGPHGLAQTADIPYAQAKDFIDNYFVVYQGIKKYVEDMITKGRTDGYVETLFGRKRFVPEINSSVMAIKKGAERMAINTPIQGTAADMIKIAMIRVSDYLHEINREKIVAKMLLQVHDELVFEIKEDRIDEITKKIKEIMETVSELKVPVEVDVKTGDNWSDMKKVEIL